MASVYAIAAWILIQASNTMFLDFGISRTDVRIVILVLVFLFSVVLAVGRHKDAMTHNWAAQNNV